MGATKVMGKDPGALLAKLAEKIATIVKVLDRPTWEVLEKRAPDIGLSADVLKMLLGKLTETGVVYVKDGRYGLTPLGAGIASGAMETKSIYCFGDKEVASEAAHVLISRGAEIAMVIVSEGDGSSNFCVASMGPGNPEALPPLLEEMAQIIRVRIAEGQEPIEAN